jgi:hypothetical protein
MLPCDVNFIREETGDECSFHFHISPLQLAFTRVSPRAHLSFNAVSFDSDCGIGFGLPGFDSSFQFRNCTLRHGQKMVRISGKCTREDLERKYPGVDFSMFNLVQLSVINSSAPLTERQQYSASLFTASSLRLFERINGYPLERMPASPMTHSKFFSKKKVVACHDEHPLSR